MRIRKFNEYLDIKKPSIIDLEYVKECFIDVIDMGFKFEVDYLAVNGDHDVMNNNNCEVTINLIMQDYYSISEIVNSLDVYIEKVKIKYDVSSRIFFRISAPISINIEFIKK